MISTADAIAALGIGLAGAGHCLGMCGGIAAALSLGQGAGPAMTFAYHGGRLASYALLGGLLGLIAGSINIAAWTLGLRYLAGLLLVAMGLAIADWWRGIGLLERAGARLWQPVQRLSAGLLPLRTPRQAVLLGLCWGLMPCGLIYSALAWTASSQSAIDGALLMLLFGAGTLPAMLATSFGASGVQALLRRRGLKILIGIMLIAMGSWSLYLTASHGGHMLRMAPGATESMGSMEGDAAPMHRH
ncbi:MAG: sulfite exporter TauE/SafE family protein [Halieaceae bacterium]|jgi:sulfite exporter TauE/SafE|nr:sulfite exporter TauE/SafE family protein [Halieaceae bacterium]